MKIIYDFGANQGQNLNYYLNKADVVVGVEANPLLCDKIENDFSKQIDEKRLFLERGVLISSENQDERKQPFYIHNKNHRLSTVICPNDIDNYTKFILPKIHVMDIIKKYGYPHYIKIDLEGYDQFILKDLFDNTIIPKYVSAEFSSPQVLDLMVVNGYTKFKLVDGWTLNYGAGPFGEDINNHKWINVNTFVDVMKNVRIGWKDIHAKNENIIS